MHVGWVDGWMGGWVVVLIHFFIHFCVGNRGGAGGVAFSPSHLRLFLLLLLLLLLLLHFYKCSSCHGFSSYRRTSFLLRKGRWVGGWMGGLIGYGLFEWIMDRWVGGWVGEWDERVTHY